MNYPNFEEAQKELFAFLEAHPELVPMQKEIENTILKYAGNDPVMRLNILTDMMKQSLTELSVELKLLNYKLLSLTEESKTLH